jgi:hypothetical protein
MPANDLAPASVATCRRAAALFLGIHRNLKQLGRFYVLVQSHRGRIATQNA